MPGIAYARKVGGKDTAARLAKEWDNVYPPLRLALYSLAKFVRNKFGIKNLVVTCIYRTEDENARLKNSNPDSLHTLEHNTRAVDLRVWGIPVYMRDQMRAWWYANNPVGFDLIDEVDHLHAEVDERFLAEETYHAPGV